MQREGTNINLVTSWASTRSGTDLSPAAIEKALPAAERAAMSISQNVCADNVSCIAHVVLQILPATRETIRRQRTRVFKLVVAKFLESHGGTIFVVEIFSDTTTTYDRRPKNVHPWRLVPNIAWKHSLPSLSRGICAGVFNFWW